MKRRICIGSLVLNLRLYPKIRTAEAAFYRLGLSVDVEEPQPFQFTPSLLCYGRTRVIWKDEENKSNCTWSCISHLRTGDFTPCFSLVLIPLFDEQLLRILRGLRAPCTCPSHALIGSSHWQKRWPKAKRNLICNLHIIIISPWPGLVTRLTNARAVGPLLPL